MVDRSARFFSETASMRTLTVSAFPQGDWSFRIGLSLVLLFAAAEIFSVGYYYIGGKRLARAAAEPQTKAVVAAPTPSLAALSTPAPTLAPMATPSVKLAVSPTAAPSAAPAVAQPPAPMVAPTPVLTLAQTPAPSVAPSVAPTKAPVVAATSTAAPTKAPVVAATPSAAPTKAPVVAATSSAAPTKAPVVSATSPAPPPSTQSIADRLTKEASTLQRKGDTTTALARLQEAIQRDPKNAEAFAEMATIYETIRLYDRSNETWRKVQDIGPSAGPVYELAMLKLKIGTAATPAPAVVEASPAETATPRTSTDGIPDGSTFGIAEVSTTENPDIEAETNLMVRIGVKKRPSAVVDHTKVKIQVFFYDTVDDKDIKLTDADVNYEWLTPNHDWAQSNPEVLAVTYIRAKNKALSQEAALSAAAAAIIPGKKNQPAKPATPASEVGRRKYLGYIVRVYYNDKLQAQRAEPTKLLSLFPSPSTASSP
jgi:tetratricopeptide (TPR) repeat protein